jgi:signal transduction histidine kinase
LENSTPIEIPLFIVVSTAGILILIAFAVFFVMFYQKKTLQNRAQTIETEKQHQIELLHNTIEIAELERKRIANNVHDDIGGVINLVKMNISSITKNNADSELVKRLGDESKALLESTIENVRNISRDLAPPVLLRMGLIDGVDELSKQITQSTNFKVSFERPNVDFILPPQRELQLYRIILEITNNVLKHSGASQIFIKMASENEKMLVSLAHNGKGVSNNEIESMTQKSIGLGLKSIANRAKVINAKINYTKDQSNSLITIETTI